MENKHQDFPPKIQNGKSHKHHHAKLALKTIPGQNKIDRVTSISLIHRWYSRNFGENGAEWSEEADLNAEALWESEVRTTWFCGAASTGWADEV